MLAGAAECADSNRRVGVRPCATYDAQLLPSVAKIGNTSDQPGASIGMQLLHGLQ